MSSIYIKDLQSGTVREYGTNQHDSLAISGDGRTLSYYNLQCGDGSDYGDFRFVMEDGKVPSESNEPDARHGESYFNIGGFANEEEIRTDERTKVVEEFRQYLKTVIPREMPQEIWNMGVDNTCDRMLKEQIGEKND